MYNCDAGTYIVGTLAFLLKRGAPIMEHALSTALGRRCGSAAYLSSRYNLQQLAASLLSNHNIINTTHSSLTILIYIKIIFINKIL
jgi:hypothetical protein